MIEIVTHLYIGNQYDFEANVKRQSGWAVVHACKEPYHREALGYSGRAVSKDQPEYLIARRGNRLMLNLIDADNPAFIPKQIIDEALTYIRDRLDNGNKVLVHCNQGASRAPAIGLLYLAHFTDKLPAITFSEAEIAFRTIYPPYNPAPGVRGFLIQNWEQYKSS